jgi:hypothetical protein
LPTITSLEDAMQIIEKWLNFSKNKTTKSF